MNRIIYILLIVFAAGTSFAQVPQIINIEKTHSWTGDSLVIVGNNFSTNIADLEVWFGPVEAEIVSATNTVLEVIVPVQAHYDPITVIRKSQGLRGYSSRKFYPTYGGETFDPAKFSAPLSFNALSGQGEFYDICSCDLNNDGKTDLVATKFSGATDITLLINTSTPENLSYTRLDQSSVPSLNVATQTLNISCSDVNNDGKPDIVASRFTAGGGARNEVYVLRNTSSGATISFAPKVSLVLPANVQSRGVAVVDLDGDGKPEVVIADSASDDIYIFKNNSSTSNLQFPATAAMISVPGAIGYNRIDYTDMDNDGLQDLIISPFIDNNLYVLLNTSTTNNFSFTISEINSGNKTFIRVQAGDVNADGLPDIVATNTIDAEVHVYRNEGNTTFAAPLILKGEVSTWGLDLADINGDGLVDIIAGNNSSPKINVFINDHSTATTLAFTKNTIDIDLSTRNLYVGDLDGDAKPDIAFTVTGGGSSAPYKLEILRNLNCFVPNIRNVEPLSICPTQQMQINAIPNPAATYNWYQDNVLVKTGTDNFLDITYESPDVTYKVEAVTEGGACTTSDEIVVEDGTGTIPGNPTPSVTSSPVCEGEDIELAVQDIAGAVYKWSGPNGFSSSLRNPVINNANTDMAGVYTVFIKQGDCLSSEESVIVEVATLPTFNASAQGSATICQGSTSTLSVTSRGGYTYAWQKDGVAIPGANNATFIASETGSYSVLVTNNTTGCDVTTNEVDLLVVAPPVSGFDVSATNICLGETVTINNNTTSDNNATPVYNWTFGDGTSSPDASPTITYTTEDVFDITLNVSYNGVSGCTDSEMHQVTVNAPDVPEITADVTEICPGEEATLTVGGTFSQTTWNTGENTNSIVTNTADTYSVTTIDNNGCESSDDIIIDAKDVPVLQVTANTATVPQPVMDTIFIDPGTVVSLQAAGADTYSWTPTEPLDDASISNPQATVTQSTQFYVTGLLTGECSAIDSVYIKINESGEGLAINPKKVFAPESTINPTWIIDLPLSYIGCSLAIYDERGVKILEESVGYYEWDGTANGNPVPEGVYYYVVGCPTEGTKAGTVLVVRQ